MITGAEGGKEEGKIEAGYIRQTLARLWETQVTAVAYSQELEQFQDALLTPPSAPANGFVLDADLLVGESFCQAQVRYDRTHTFLYK